jgi:hypothetical protein
MLTMSERDTGSKSRKSRVELTPAMIDAGVRELAYFNRQEDSLEAAVWSIFHAMIECQEAAEEGKWELTDDAEWHKRC